MSTHFDVKITSPESGREYEIVVWRNGYMDIDLSVYWIVSRSWFGTKRERVYFKNFENKQDAIKAAEQFIREISTNPIFAVKNENTATSNS